DSGHGKMVRTQTQRRYADEKASPDRKNNACHKGCPQGPAPIDDEKSAGIGSDRHESGLAEVGKPREADIQLQAERKYPVDGREDADIDPEIDAHERRAARPNIPWGMKSRTR